MAQPRVTVHAVMLSSCPSLVDALHLNTVPIVFINQTRLDGPLNEWVLLHHVLNTSTR